MTTARLIQRQSKASTSQASPVPLNATLIINTETTVKSQLPLKIITNSDSSNDPTSFRDNINNVVSDREHNFLTDFSALTIQIIGTSGMSNRVVYQVLNLKLDKFTPKLDALGMLPAVTTDVQSIMQECRAIIASLVKPTPPPTFANGSPPHKIAALNRNNMEMEPTIPVASNTFPFFEAHGVQTTSSTSSTNQLI